MSTTFASLRMPCRPWRLRRWRAHCAPVVYIVLNYVPTRWAEHPANVVRPPRVDRGSIKSWAVIVKQRRCA
ncbi:hypothetical protein LX36DRAFT_649000 [Colletotrichum falcatum]|nr:hypothetical protein LX36DRAFT_649000 [Colletotrichum falcatum]